MSTVTTPAEIGKLYDEACRLSGIFNDGQEHLAYWYDNQDDTPIIEAGKRLTRRVVDTLGLRPGEHVLDAGCGVGAPAIMVAQETGARVTGITISSAEATEAGQRAAASGLNGQVRFQHGDYMSIPYPDGTFDAVLAIESLTHAPDLEAALREFSRVLRPGGRVAISECTRMHPDAQIPDLYKANRLMALPEWIDALQAAGFVVEEYTQCGRRVYGMGLRYLDRADELHDTLVSNFGADIVGALKQGYRDMFGAGPENMGYAILAARKPAAGRTCANCGTVY
jgi:ubiquinone/menaquinone biosynthesis C-methylase UbiE